MGIIHFLLVHFIRTIRSRKESFNSNFNHAVVLSMPISEFKFQSTQISSFLNQFLNSNFNHAVVLSMSISEFKFQSNQISSFLNQFLNSNFNHAVVLSMPS